MSVCDPLSLEHGQSTVWYLGVLLLAAVPTPLVHFGTVQAESFGEGYDSVRIESWVDLVLPLQGNLLLFIQVAAAQALTFLRSSLVTTVSI